MDSYRRLAPDLYDIQRQVTAEQRRRRTRGSDLRIAALQEKASQLAAAIYALPMECLCYIFIWGAQMDATFPITVSHVCKGWRRVALHYAPLWATIRVRSKNGSECDRLRVWLKRAGNSLLDVEMVVPETVMGVHTLIKEHIDHCYKLLLWNVAPTKIELIESASHTLRSLDLAGFHVCSINAVLSLLQGCPNLQQLALRYVQFHPTNRGIEDTSCAFITLEYLRELMLPEWSPELINSLLPQLYTPQLLVVDISAHTCDPQHSSTLSLRPRDGSWVHVKRFTARGCAFTDSVVVEGLELLPSAETVILRSVWVSDALVMALCTRTRLGYLVPSLFQLHLNALHDLTTRALQALIVSRCRTKTTPLVAGRTFLDRICMQGCGKVSQELDEWRKTRPEMLDLIIVDND